MEVWVCSLVKSPPFIYAQFNLIESKKQIGRLANELGGGFRLVLWLIGGAEAGIGIKYTQLGVIQSGI